MWLISFSESNIFWLERSHWVFKVLDCVAFQAALDNYYWLAVTDLPSDIIIWPCSARTSQLVLTYIRHNRGNCWHSTGGLKGRTKRVLRSGDSDTDSTLIYWMKVSCIHQCTLIYWGLYYHCIVQLQCSLFYNNGMNIIRWFYVFILLRFM